jgi:hypothetical protein
VSEFDSALRKRLRLRPSRNLQPDTVEEHIRGAGNQAAAEDDDFGIQGAYEIGDSHGGIHRPRDRYR